MHCSDHTDIPDFAARLLQWFDQYGRKDLPWQQNKTPYRVWVSEIMLQQTQVASVIVYYQRFMQSFPDVKTLANAPEDQVLEHWAGLGYYARARNLHKAAKQIVAQHEAVFPDSFDDIIALPGIGRSTAGAILSIAFKQRASILDGNVKRVLCRHRAIDEWPGKTSIETTLWSLAGALTPEQNVDRYTQAIMDLGATLCTRTKPTCEACPVNDDCLAKQRNLQAELPKPKPKKTIPLRHTWMTHVENSQGEILLEKRPPSGIWGGLYSLPEWPAELDSAEIAAELTRQYGFELTSITEATPFVHTFSHYKLAIQPIQVKVLNSGLGIRSNDTLLWVKKDKLQQLGLPAPVTKYLNKLIHPSVATP